MQCPNCRNRLNIPAGVCPYCHNVFDLRTIGLNPRRVVTEALSRLAKGLDSIWSAETINRRAAIGGAMVWSASFHPDNEHIAIGCSDGCIRVLHIGKKLVSNSIPAHHKVVVSLSFSPDGKFIASASHDQTVCIVDAASGCILRRIESGEAKVYCVAFSNTPELVATGSADKTVKLWNTIDGSLLREFTGHSASVTAIAFSKQSTVLASGSRDTSVRIWDLRTGEPRSILVSPLQLAGRDFADVFLSKQDWIQYLSFSPDGKYLLAASVEHLRLWEPWTGMLKRVFVGHTGWINVALVSPCGRLALSCGQDRNIILWDIATGTMLQAVGFHEDEVGALSLSPSGEWLVSGGPDGKVAIWHLSYDPAQITLRSIYDVSFNTWQSV